MKFLNAKWRSAVSCLPFLTTRIEKATVISIFGSAIGWLNPGVLDTSIETAQRDFLSPVYALLAGDVTLTQLRDKIQPHQFRLIFGLTNTGNGAPLTATGGDADAIDLQKVQSVNGPSIIVFPTIGDPDENLRAREVKKMIEPVLAKSIPLVPPPDLEVVRHPWLLHFLTRATLLMRYSKMLRPEEQLKATHSLGSARSFWSESQAPANQHLRSKLAKCFGLKPLLYGCAASTPTACSEAPPGHGARA